ncbi:DUF1707 domain-containing protein [Herbidospora mongoliensis]|uniref:DUF1707 domain-containing protein n=1 Tax=Herbidospora mongoliensis TaxID=688067 RepID=UPI00082A8396|nr:DUF1707 domain-containing protein [Herbidospora mongoliensis]
MTIEDPGQRASDADRDQVAAVIAEGLATGRLTTAEHADRLEAAYSAVTMGELVPITKDLPSTVTASAPADVGRKKISAAFSKVIKSGRWVPGRSLHLQAAFGALIIDLHDAVLPGREITIDISAAFSKVIIRVPANANVIDDGSAVFAKRIVSGGETDDGPVIRITGNAAFSKVIVSGKVWDPNLRR